MPQPASVLHITRPLSDYVQAYRPQMSGYLGLSLLPNKTVKSQSDLIRVENKGQLLRKHDIRIGSNGRRREIDFKMDASQQYATTSYGPEVVLYRDEMDQADDELTYQQRKIDHGLISVYTTMEYIAVKDVMRVAGNWGASTTNLATTPSKQYDQHFGTGNPPEDFLYICDRISSATGHRPNCIALHEMTWSQIATHPATLARGETQSGGLGIVTPEQFEKVIRVEPGTIKITNASYNTAIEGAADDFRSFMGPDVIFAYNEPGKINSFGLGQTFMYNGAMDAGAGLRKWPEEANDLPGANIAIRAYDAPHLGSDGAIVVNLTTKFDIKLLNASNAGWLLRNAVDGTNTSLFGNYLNN